MWEIKRNASLTKHVKTHSEENLMSKINVGNLLIQTKGFI